MDGRYCLTAGGLGPHIPFLVPLGLPPSFLFPSFPLSPPHSVGAQAGMASLATEHQCTSGSSRGYPALPCARAPPAFPVEGSWSR